MTPRTRWSRSARGPGPDRTPDASASRSTALAAPEPAVVAGQEDEGGGGRGPMGRRLGQSVLLGFERPLLVGRGDGRGLDLVHLEGQHLGLAGALPGVATEALGLAQEGGQAGPGRLHGPEFDGAEGVERLALGLGDGQCPVLVLAVQLDQPGGRLGQCAEGHHAAVDPGLRPALAGDGAGQEDLVVSVDVAEASLDQCLLGAGPHDRRVGPAAEQQAEGADQQRLARPGLAGQRGHAGPEADGDLVDHPEVADVELDQQATHPNP